MEQCVHHVHYTLHFPTDDQVRYQPSFSYLELPRCLIPHRSDHPTFIIIIIIIIIHGNKQGRKYTQVSLHHSHKDFLLEKYVYIILVLAVVCTVTVVLYNTSTHLIHP